MTNTQPHAAEQITTTVGSWPGVETAPHRFGGVEFRLGRRELGHLHGNRIADLPFPRRVRDQLIAEGRAQPHRILPDSGWITFPINAPTDVQDAIQLFRLSYERASQAQHKATGRVTQGSPPADGVPPAD